MGPGFRFSERAALATLPNTRPEKTQNAKATGPRRSTHNTLHVSAAPARRAEGRNGEAIAGVPSREMPRFHGQRISCDSRGAPRRRSPTGFLVCAATAAAAAPARTEKPPQPRDGGSTGYIGEGKAVGSAVEDLRRPRGLSSPASLAGAAHNLKESETGSVGPMDSLENLHSIYSLSSPRTGSTASPEQQMVGQGDTYGKGAAVAVRFGQGREEEQEKHEGNKQVRKSVDGETKNLPVLVQHASSSWGYISLGVYWIGVFCSFAPLQHARWLALAAALRCESAQRALMPAAAACVALRGIVRVRRTAKEKKTPSVDLRCFFCAPDNSICSSRCAECLEGS